MSEVRFQMLRLAVEVCSDEDEVLEGVRFLVQGARQPKPPTQELRCTVERVGDRYEVHVDGVVLDRAPSPGAVLDTLFAFTHERALELFGDHALVRGAVVRDGPTRSLLIGEPGCGLTSLAIQLLYQGVAVEGDAFALLGSDGLTPLPRRFLMRTGKRELLPELSGLLDTLPEIARGGDMISGLDPTEAGFDWEIRYGPIDACVAVQANHGGQSRLTPSSQTDMARLVSGFCTPPVAGGGGWLRAVVALLDGTACWHLQLGRLDDATTLLHLAWEKSLV